MRPGAAACTVSAWLRRRDYAKVEALAKHEGVTKAAIVRRAVEQYLDGQAKPLVSPGRPWELDD